MIIARDIRPGDILPAGDPESLTRVYTVTKIARFFGKTHVTVEYLDGGTGAREFDYYEETPLVRPDSDN